MSKKGKMVFVASHSRTLGAHYANSDRLICNEVPNVKKLRVSIKNLQLFSPSEFFHQEIGRTEGIWLRLLKAGQA